ncbi:MAG: hypothetical protein ACC618_04330 [Patescibacteria group bacterium]
MLNYFIKAKEHLESIDLASCDPLDKKAHELMNDGEAYERASQSLRRRFSRGAKEVTGVDRGGNRTKVKREKVGGKYKYLVMGSDGNWNEPEERIWVVAMYALWQATK